jgi:flagellar motor switch protein FliG
MKLGIKKIHENDWQLHIDRAFIHLDRFSLELLCSNLEHLQAMSLGQQGSILAGYIKLAEKILEISDEDAQLLLRNVDNNDVLILIKSIDKTEINNKIMQNVGLIIAKQLSSDSEDSLCPSEEEAIRAIKNITEKIFELEMAGKIEFLNKDSKFI